MRRTVLTLALVLGAALPGGTAAHAGSDPQAKKPSADAHPPKKAEPHAAKADAHPPAADAHAAKANAPAAKPKAGAAPKPSGSEKPVATDLHALSERIQERLSEVLKAQAATAAKPDPSAPPAARAHGTSGHRTTTRSERVEVVWRIDVAWPEDVHARDAAAQRVGERVSVSWEPSPEVPADVPPHRSFGPQAD